MKFQLITLLSVGLCFAAVSARFDSSDEDQFDQQCLMEIMSCGRHVQQYQSHDPTEVASKLRQAGLRAVCGDTTKATECALQVLLQDKCKGMPEDARRMFLKSFDVINFICVNRINDIENHWECLFNVAIDQKLGDCQNMDSGLSQCDISGFMRCVDGTFSSSNLCKPGAKELVRDVMKKVISIFPHCPDQKIVHRAVMNFLRKK